MLHKGHAYILAYYVWIIILPKDPKIIFFLLVFQSEDTYLKGPGISKTKLCQAL